jgi:hypothetical protein
MSLKKNWPAVYADIEQLFSDPPDSVVFETNETGDLTGGRIETRRHTVCHKGGLVRASYRRITALNTLSEFSQRRRRPGHSDPGSGLDDQCRCGISGLLRVPKQFFITIYYQARK